ncbi:uncharacterized protein LOC62_06G008017 [Vanrija pseudolonga]|uniref:Uncharacterized protein n=1 Tax=Vanrija pseudolonga TaxID=143232 RepID=A0AAF0YD33_9TREE|nr:hypothetical protein LOC62_06G008017 [Vanrija pseudolonga]
MDAATQRERQRARAHLLSLRLSPPFTTESLILHLQAFEEIVNTAFPHCVRPKESQPAKEQPKGGKPDPVPSVRWLFFLETLPESIAQAVTDHTYSTVYADLRMAYIAVCCAVDDLAVEQRYGPQAYHDKIAALRLGDPLLLIDEANSGRKTCAKSVTPKLKKEAKAKTKVKKQPLGESTTHNLPDAPPPGLFESLAAPKIKPAPIPPLSTKVVPVERMTVPGPVWSSPVPATAGNTKGKTKPPRQPRLTVHTAAGDRLVPKPSLSRAIAASFILDPTATEHFVQRDLLPLATKGERVLFASKILEAHSTVVRAASLFLSPLGEINAVEVSNVYTAENKHETRLNVLSVPRLHENGWVINRLRLGSDTLHHPASGAAFKIERLRGGEEAVLVTSCKTKARRSSLLSLRLSPPYTAGALKTHLRIFEDHDQILRELVPDKDRLRIIKAQLFLESLSIEISEALTENRTFPEPVTYHKVRSAYVQLKPRAVPSRPLEYGPQPVHQRLAALEPGQILCDVDDLSTQVAHLRLNETPKRTHIRFPDTPKAIAQLDADTSSDESDSSYRPSTSDEESSDEDDEEGYTSDEHSHQELGASSAPSVADNATPSGTDELNVFVPVPDAPDASLHPRWKVFDAVINTARTKLDHRDQPIFDRRVDTELGNLAAALAAWQPHSTPPVPLSTTTKKHTSHYDLREITLVIDETATHHVVTPGYLMARRKGPKVTFSSTTLGVDPVTLSSIGKLFISGVQDTSSKGDLVGIEIKNVYVGGASRVGSEFNILSKTLLVQQGWVFETSTTRELLLHSESGVSFDIKKSGLVGGKEGMDEIVACAWWRLDE